MRKKNKMGFEKFENRLETFTRTFSRSIEWLGVIGLLVMFLVNLGDVVGAKLFTWPLPGSVEVISFSQIVAIASAMAFALLLGRHIRVDFILNRFPRRFRAVMNGISSLLAFILFVIIVWQSCLYGVSLQKAGEIGSTSHWPLYPFAYFIAFCCIPVCLVFLLEVLKFTFEVFGHGSR